MESFGKQVARRRLRNAKALSAFGIGASMAEASSHLRTVREGKGPTVVTIGYERRTGQELVGVLRQAGVEVLIDVRDKALSRRPDFRGAALQTRCEDAGITYEHMSELGSTTGQRAKLRETGDISGFRRRFRAYARRRLEQPLAHLAHLAASRAVALLCYERAHEDCHRSVLTDLIAPRLDARIVAVV